MKRLFKFLACIFLVGVMLLGYYHKTHAFSPNLLMDDTVFNDSASISAAQIDSWLNNNWGSASCISTSHGFGAPDVVGYNPSQGFLYGNSPVSAGQVIYDAAQAYDINPEVLLATLQKEQSLVTGETGCTIVGDTGAMGYGCPDSGTSHSYPAEGALLTPLFYLNNSPINSVSGTCVNSAAKAGFSEQVIHAAWLLKFGEQRSEGNTTFNIQKPGWDNSDDPQTCYGGPMTQGTFKRCPNGTATFYDGYTTIDGSATHMDTGATATLYWYTPHFSGNQHFVSIFSSWFGGTVSASYYSCHNASNIIGVGYAAKVLPNRLTSGQADHLMLTFLNNTGSACIEAHTWNYGEQSWYSNVATNHPALNPADDELITADTNGDGKDELILVKLRGGASGKIEVHTWDPTYQHWISNIATNHPAVNPVNDEVIAGDFYGTGKDELALVKLAGGESGKVEVHIWALGEQSWLNNIATNLPAVNPADDRVIAANTITDGDRIDKFILVKYQNTVSGKIEVHTWNPGEQSWYSNVAANHPMVDPANDEVIAADTNGDQKDELVLVKYRSGESGKVELHVWGPNQQTWLDHIATNHPMVDPALSYTLN